MTIEEPKFTLALKDGAFELRDYAPMVVAEVTVTGDQQAAGRRGFRRLAGYIFGANARREKIAMTAPVTQTPEAGDWLVRFTMPGRLALADLPQPDGADVILRAVPAARLAVWRFSGLTGEAKVAAEMARLMSSLKTRGLVPTGPASIARYDPPWIPWFLRRNEVMCPVAAPA